VHLRTDDSDDVREKTRKIRRKICKERRKTGMTQIRLEWAEDQWEGELQGNPLDGVLPVRKRVSGFRGGWVVVVVRSE
jgi:hypothetical protein